MTTIDMRLRNNYVANFCNISFVYIIIYFFFFFFFFQAEDGIRDGTVTGVQTCALPIFQAAATEAGLKRFEVRLEDSDNGGGLVVHLSGDAAIDIPTEVLKSPDYQLLFDVFQDLPPLDRKSVV